LFTRNICRKGKSDGKRGIRLYCRFRGEAIAIEAVIKEYTEYGKRVAKYVADVSG
jgi:hypothetical protein